MHYRVETYRGFSMVVYAALGFETPFESCFFVNP